MEGLEPLSFKGGRVFARGGDSSGWGGHADPYGMTNTETSKGTSQETSKGTNQDGQQGWPTRMANKAGQQSWAEDDCVVGIRHSGERR